MIMLRPGKRELAVTEQVAEGPRSHLGGSSSYDSVRAGLAYKF
jgi:hypothetical protein